MLKYLFLIVFIFSMLLTSCSDDLPIQPNKNTRTIVFPLAKGNSWTNHYTRFDKQGVIISQSDQTESIIDTMSFKWDGKILLLYITKETDYSKEGRYEDDKAYYTFSWKNNGNFSTNKIIDKRVSLNQIISMTNSGGFNNKQIKILDLDATAKFGLVTIPCIKLQVLDRRDNNNLKKDYAYWSNKYGVILEERRIYDSNYKQFLLHHRIELKEVTIK